MKVIGFLDWSALFGTGLADWAPVLGLAAAISIGLVVLHGVLLGKKRGAEKSLPRQLTLAGLTVAGLIVVVLMLPIEVELRGQILSLLGLLFTAVIALSSTTFMANAMGGLMLRVVRSFRAGDFIRVGEDFGRVTERGLFHTEIQTEDRDLVTLPNLYVITNPVRVVRTSGTVVSVELSLGYDVPRDKIEECLKAAAKGAGLEDGFVLVKELGDFAVTYKVAGFLRDIERMLTTRSRLRASVLDSLHGAGIEIVSPSFMNQRPIPPGESVIPLVKHTVADDDDDEPTAEAVAFDKGSQAKELEVLRDELGVVIERLGEKPEADERAALEARKTDLESRLERAEGDLSES